MARITRDTIDKIYASTNIVDVIADYVNLKKRGANFVGLSPFVNEKTPSFYVSAAKGIFKDFSSGNGGDAVSFIMQMEKVTYPEALRLIARKFNIPIEEENLSEESALQEKNENDAREALYVVNEFAKNYFANTLHQHEEGTAIAMSYFMERKLSVETIKKFQLGYCLNGKTTFTDNAMDQGYSLDILIKAGLTKSNDDRTWKVDAFNGRVIFPIHNLTGRTVGFGARTLSNAKDVAKYINTSETEVYNKSKVLYGLHLAKKAITQHSNVYLVEGYMDVIAMFEAGFENTVASSGTSLTQEQVRQLRKFTNNITIVYDGDAAGVKASLRAIEIILEEGLQVKLILFPNNDDPDSYLKKIGTQAFVEYVNNKAINFVQYRRAITEEVLIKDPLRKTEVVQELLNTIAYVNNLIARSVYLQEVANIFQIQESVLTNELNKLLRKRMNKASISNDNTSETDAPLTVEQVINEIETPLTPLIEQQEFDFIRMIIQHGTKRVFFEITNEQQVLETIEVSVAEYLIQLLDSEQVQFKNEVYSLLIQEVKNYFESGFVPDEHFYLHHPKQVISTIAIDLVAKEMEPSKYWKQKFNMITLREEHFLKESIEKTLKLYKYRLLDEIANANMQFLKEYSDVDSTNDVLLLQRQLDQLRVKLGVYLKPIIE